MDGDRPNQPVPSISREMTTPRHRAVIVIVLLLRDELVHQLWVLSGHLLDSLHQRNLPPREIHQTEVRDTDLGLDLSGKGRMAAFLLCKNHVRKQLTRKQIEVLFLRES